MTLRHSSTKLTLSNPPKSDASIQDPPLTLQILQDSLHSFSVLITGSTIQKELFMKFWTDIEIIWRD